MDMVETAVSVSISWLQLRSEISLYEWQVTSYTSLLYAAAIHTAHPMFPLCPQFMQIPPFSCLLATDEIAIIEKVSCLIYRIRQMALAPNVVLVNSRENGRYMRS
jgi:hypothetical protein